jgi:hypothetical protein
MIDLVLNSANVTPKDNMNYILLRKVVSKKLKVKKSERMATFRKNNELNLQIIKKICKVQVERMAIDASMSDQPELKKNSASAPES